MMVCKAEMMQLRNDVVRVAHKFASENSIYKISPAWKISMPGFAVAIGFIHVCAADTSLF